MKKKTIFSNIWISDQYSPLQMILPNHDLNPSIRMSPEDYRDTFWAMLRDAIDQVGEYITMDTIDHE